MDEFVPIDKSWAIRHGVKDLASDTPHTTTVDQLRGLELSDDLLALVRASDEWMSGSDVIHVGESATLFRFLWWLAQLEGRKVDFVKERTLSRRAVTAEAWILDLPIEELLELDGGTSQWASAAVLFGRVAGEGAHLSKLSMSIQAWASHGSVSGVRPDETIRRHMLACLTGEFVPEHSEDACLAMAMGLMTPAEAGARWPQIASHESDRLVAMDVALWRVRHGKMKIITDDHRVIQAMAITHGMGPECFSNFGYYVSKSWPQFWPFMRFALAR